MTTLAQRLSSSLGVGKLKNQTERNTLLGFMREGVRFAFSTEDPGQDSDLPLGARLLFLCILAK